MSARHRHHRDKIAATRRELADLRDLEQAFEAVRKDIRDLKWNGSDVTDHVLAIRHQEIVIKCACLVNDIDELERSMPK